jgi:hypothetical protein
MINEYTKSLFHWLYFILMTSMREDKMMWIMITLHCSAIEKWLENELDFAIVIWMHNYYLVMTCINEDMAF